MSKNKKIKMTKKGIVIELQNVVQIPKETPEERKERIRNMGSSMATKVVPSKKTYNRKKLKKSMEEY